MGACAQCQHFRRVKPPSQLLASTYSTTHAEVSQALNKIVEDENKQRDEESQYKRSQAAAGKAAWSYKPVMSDFCAFGEQKGEFYIAEVKNAGLACKDFATGKPARHSCSDCAHRVSGEGVARDRKTEEMYSKMAIQAASVKASASSPEGLLKAHREGAASRKAFELAGIYSSKGVLPTAPTYADHCGLLSSQDEFIVCVLYNPHNTCDKWQGAQQQGAPPQGAEQPAPPLAPPPVPLAAAVPAQPGWSAPAPNLEQVLASGPVPLTLGMVRKYVAFWDWILDVRVPDAIGQQIQIMLVSAWGGGDQQTIATTQQLNTFFDQVSTQNLETRDAIREEHQAQFVNGLRAAGVPTAQMLVNLYDHANQPIAQGNPPLTQEIANCYYDLIALVQSLQSGLEWHPLPDHVKAGYTRVLASQYPGLHPAQQQWFGNLPRGWTSIRASWKNVTPDAREQLRQQILNSLGALANSMPNLAAAAVFGPPSVPQPQGGMQPAQGGYEAQGGYAAQPAQGGATTDALVSQILEADKKQEAELEKENPELALQAKMQNSARNAQLLSNMMQMRYDSMMSIARNIR